MTGKVTENGVKTEVIDLLDPDNHCVFPDTLSEATGGLLGTDVPMIFGGHIGGDSPGDQCYILRNKDFIPVVKLNKASQEFGYGSVVYNNSLIILQGYDTSDESKQFLSVSLEEGVQDLPDTHLGNNCKYAFW